MAFIRGRDLMAEIWNSKLSYCDVYEREYTTPDVITDDLQTVTTPDLTIRLDCDDHINRFEPDASPPRRGSLGHLDRRVTFAPFRLYRSFLNAGVVTYREVARSHWKRGAYKPDGGRLSNGLAVMMMQIVEGYGSRSSWRGYSWGDEMKSEALVHLCRVILQFNESKSDNPHAYVTMIVQNAFRAELADQKRHSMIRDAVLHAEGAMPSMNAEHEDLIGVKKKPYTGAKRGPRPKYGPPKPKAVVEKPPKASKPPKSPKSPKPPKPPKVVIEKKPSPPKRVVRAGWHRDVRIQAQKAIFGAIAEDQMGTSDIAKRTSLAPLTVRQHLRVLVKVGLISKWEGRTLKFSRMPGLDESEISARLIRAGELPLASLDPDRQIPVKGWHKMSNLSKQQTLFAALEDDFIDTTEVRARTGIAKVSALRHLKIIRDVGLIEIVGVKPMLFRRRPGLDKAIIAAGLKAAGQIKSCTD